VCVNRLLAVGSVGERTRTATESRGRKKGRIRTGACVRWNDNHSSLALFREARKKVRENFRNIERLGSFARRREDSSVRRSLSVRYKTRAGKKLPCISRNKRNILYTAMVIALHRSYSRRTELSGKFLSRTIARQEKERGRDGGTVKEMELWRCLKRRSECEKEEPRGTRISYTHWR
jgi:hypothetical protein